MVLSPADRLQGAFARHALASLETLAVEDVQGIDAVQADRARCSSAALRRSLLAASSDAALDQGVNAAVASKLQDVRGWAWRGVRSCHASETQSSCVPLLMAPSTAFVSVSEEFLAGHQSGNRYCSDQPSQHAVAARHLSGRVIVCMVPSSRTADRELAGILQGISVGLLLVYLVSELKLLLPPALLQPAWQLRAGEALRSTAPLPLVAGALLLLAQRFDAGAAGLGRRVVLVRRLAIAASLGFLLLIPLQISAGLRQLSQNTAVEARQLEAVRKVAVAIEQAKTPEAMNKAIASLPGLPPDFQGQYARPLPQVRAALLLQIRPQIQRLEGRLQELRRQRLFSATGLFALDGLLSLGYAIGFAALASSGEDQPSLLQRCLWQWQRLGDWFRRPGRKGSQQGPVSEDWIRSIQDDEDEAKR